jgi:hypothetical protein
MSEVLSAGFNTAGLLRVYQRFESLKGKEWNPKKFNFSREHKFGLVQLSLLSTRVSSEWWQYAHETDSHNFLHKKG